MDAQDRRRKVTDFYREIVTALTRQKGSEGRERRSVGGEGPPEILAWRHRGIGLCLLTIALTMFPGCLFFHHRRAADDLLPAGQQPDKVLYQKSIDAIAHGRYDIGRLTLQTLLNTYPDSEYLAKAKLAIADSYYEQGGTAGLTEAEAEYKDFITFFPTAPEAPMA